MPIFTSHNTGYMRRIADFSEAVKIMRYLVLRRWGVTKHIAAPRLGARAAATSYNPVRCATLQCCTIILNWRTKKIRRY